MLSTIVSECLMNIKGKVKNQSHHTNSYFSPPNSEKCILLLEEYKEEIPTLFEAWECFVEKMQFSFPLQFVCMRQTVAVWVSGLKTSCVILTSNRSVAIYISSVVHMLSTQQLLGTSQHTLGYP